MKLSDLPKHHTVFVTHGDRVMYGETLWNEVRALSHAHRYFNQTVLDIETARAIIAWAQSSYNEDRIALISFHTASLPAQNALLKILEEPRSGVRFILLSTNKDNVIPTVQSRTHHINLVTSVDSINEKHALEFMETSPAFRMKLSFIVDILSREDEEGRKDREAVKTFILALVSALTNTHAQARYITETLEIASYASDPSASGKALLEYLSLLLPQTK